MDAIARPKLTPRAKALVARVLLILNPPQRMLLSEWAEKHIVLPSAQNPMGGRFKNWPYMREIMDAIGDPSVEQVTLQKAARIGFTKGLVIALAAKVANDPCPIGMLVPRDTDVRDVAVDEIEPIFEASPELKKLMPKSREEGRVSLSRKGFVGGASLKILAAKSPANLRRHGFKVLYADEVDAMEVTTEGDPLKLAENRTLAYPDRKLVWGSTPTEEDISNVERKYGESDKRVFEARCPQCKEYFELLWRRPEKPPSDGGLKGYIEWPPGEPERAYAVCPSGCVLEERSKRWMVEHGRWRATEPEVRGHRGYKLNQLVSFLPQTGWGALALNFLEAKRAGPSQLQVFVNQTLAETWKVALNRLDASGLASRGEPFGLDAVPKEVLLLTVGADVQDDRIEATVLGWPLGSSSPLVLGHHVVDGNTVEKETWLDFDKWLKRTYKHPAGWDMGIDACAVDSGGSQGRTQQVYDFCSARSFRRVFAIKGAAGPRPLWKRAEKVKRNARLYIIGHDQAKTEVMERLALEPPDPHAIRISAELDDDWLAGVTSEVRRVRYVHNRPVIEFVPKRQGIRTEALDCLCYGYAVRFSPSVLAIDLAERASRKGGEAPRKNKAAAWAAALNG